MGEQSARRLEFRQVTSMEEVFCDLARAAEEAVHAFGWGLPATIWRVALVDTPPAPAEGTPAEAVCTTFSLELLTVVDDDPFDALAGWTATDPACLGLVLVAEYWTRPGEAAAPDAHPTARGGARTQTRVAFLIMRDGSEVMVRRPLGLDPTVLRPDADHEFSGQMAWSLRRSLGLASRVEETTPLPDPVAVRCRMVAAGTLEHLVERDVADYDRALVETALVLRQLTAETGDDWEAERLRLIAGQDRAAAEASREGDLQAAEDARAQAALLRWADGPLVAVLLDGAVAPAESLAVGLWSLTLAGAVSESAAAVFAGATGLTAPAGRWGSRPGPFTLCPCGSGARFAACHAAFVADAAA